MKGSQRRCSAHCVSWGRLQSQLPRKAGWPGDSAAPGWTRVRSYRVALWGLAPACAHLGATASDPLRPWGQAPHRVRVRRCRLPLWAGLTTATRVPLGRSSRLSVHPRPPCAGPSRQGRAHTGCRPGGPRPDTFRRRPRAGLRAGRLLGAGPATSRAQAAAASASWVQKAGRAWEDGGPGGGHAAATPLWAEARGPRSIGIGG